MFSFNDGVVARATSGARDIITASSVSAVHAPQSWKMSQIWVMCGKIKNSGEKFLHCSGPTDRFVTFTLNSGYTTRPSYKIDSI